MSDNDLVEMMAALNHISETLNQAVDVNAVLEHTLAELVKLMGLESGWILLRNPSIQDEAGGSPYALVAHHNLPPALTLENIEAWATPCTCEKLCDRGQLSQAYNEIRCSRLASSLAGRRDLAVPASVPLRSADRVLGILNVAAPAWDSFSARSLSLLTNVGNQMGIALERAQLYDQLRAQRTHEQESLIDFSNQLLSRRTLADLMHYLVQEVRAVLQADACALLLPSTEAGHLEFQAASGWRCDPSEAGRRVPAGEESGPGQVMQTLQPLVAHDLRQYDPTPWFPGWLSLENFRSHAVVPLLSNSHAIGVLVVNHRQPRTLHQDDLRCLLLMANQAAVALEQARLQAEELKMHSMEKEMELGRRIQLGLLPDAPPVVPGWEFSVFYQAAREVGGDFYDFFELPAEPGKMGLVIADVTGKGVPAALSMARSSMVIRNAALSGLSPSAALVRANEMTLRGDDLDPLLTALYSILDPATGRLEYASAGHCRPLWVQSATGHVEELAARGILLGVLSDIALEEKSIDVLPGDLLVFFTDGVTEAMNASRELFGNDRLRAIVSAHTGSSARQLLDAVVEAVQSYADPDNQSDDISIFVIKRLASED